LPARASTFSESERALPLGGDYGRRRSRNSHHPFCHPSQRLVFGIERLECRTPLVVPPLVDPAVNRPLQAVNLRFPEGSLVTCHRPRSRSFMRISSECRAVSESWVITWATLGSRCRQSLQNDAEEVLNSHIDCHPVVQFDLPSEFGSWPSQWA